MKKTILLPGAIIASLFLFQNCGNKEEAAEATITETTTETPKENSGFNSNLSLQLSESKADKIGISAGLPSGWAMEEGSVVNGNQQYIVKRGEATILYIDSEKPGKTTPAADDLAYYPDTHDILIKENAVDNNGLKRTGVIGNNKSVEDPTLKTEFEYYLAYSNGKFSYVRIIAADGYTSSAIDTCYAVIKSMKQL